MPKKTSNKKQKATAISSPASGEPAAPDAGGSDAQPSGRPDGKKKDKKKLRQGRTIEAVEFLMEKKKEADLERGLKKKERCSKAFASCALAKYLFLLPCGCGMVLTKVVHDGYMPSAR